MRKSNTPVVHTDIDHGLSDADGLLDYDAAVVYRRASDLKAASEDPLIMTCIVSSDDSDQS